MCRIHAKNKNQLLISFLLAFYLFVFLRRPMQPDCLFSKSQKVSESSKSLNQPGANVFSSENLANRWMSRKLWHIRQRYGYDDLSTKAISSTFFSHYFSYWIFGPRLEFPLQCSVHKLIFFSTWNKFWNTKISFFFVVGSPVN